MKKTLIAAKNEQICAGISEMLSEICPSPACRTDGISVRGSSVSEYELIIISTPLEDEFGLELCAWLKDNTEAELIVLTKGEIVDEVQKKIQFTGAFVLGRPVSRAVLLQAVRLAGVAKENIIRVKEENRELAQRLDDMKVINRAKLCLMEYLKLTEEQAHRHIQKQAMDMRKSQREIAEDILKTYAGSIPL